MIVGQTNDSEILTIIRDRLIARIPDFSTDNCWIDDAPIPPGDDPPPYNVCCTVTSHDSEFDAAQQLQASPCNLIEHGAIEIAVLRRMALDRPKKLDQIMLEEDRSLVGYFKPLVLQTLLLDSVTSGGNTIKRPWMPLNPRGSLLFADSLKVKKYSSPRRINDWPVLVMTLLFTASWRWQL